MSNATEQARGALALLLKRRSAGLIFPTRREGKKSPRWREREGKKSPRWCQRARLRQLWLGMRSRRRTWCCCATTPRAGASAGWAHFLFHPYDDAFHARARGTANYGMEADTGVTASSSTWGGEAFVGARCRLVCFRANGLAEPTTGTSSPDDSSSPSSSSSSSASSDPSSDTSLAILMARRVQGVVASLRGAATLRDGRPSLAGPPSPPTNQRQLPTTALKVDGGSRLSKNKMPTHLPISLVPPTHHPTICKNYGMEADTGVRR